MSIARNPSIAAVDDLMDDVPFVPCFEVNWFLGMTAADGRAWTYHTGYLARDRWTKAGHWDVPSQPLHTIAADLLRAQELGYVRLSQTKTPGAHRFTYTATRTEKPYP